MEVLASALSVADVAARASRETWTLCETWRDAPGDLEQLREDLARTNQFFDGVKRGLITDHGSVVVTTGWPYEATEQLEQLLRHGQSIITEIRRRLRLPIENATALPAEETNKIRKIRWLGMLGETTKLRRALRDNMLRICATLISVNV